MPVPRLGATLAALLMISTASARVPATVVRPRARAEREHRLVVARPIPDAFRFFEPVGEKNWAREWNPVFLSGPDAQLHEGSVFTVRTFHPALGTPLETIWAVTRYNPPELIEYRNVLPGLRATRITVRCIPAGPDRTVVHVRYVYNALSDDGDAFVTQMTDEKFRAMIDDWSAAIAAYLARGTPATP